MWITVVAWLAAAVLAAWAVVRGLGLDHGPFVQLLAFTPYVAAGAPVVALVAALLRRRLPAVAALAVGAVLIALVVPRVIPDARPAVAGPRIRVLSMNVLGGNADPAAILGLVRELRVDVLALQEHTPELDAALRAGGIGAELPYREANPEAGTGGSGLYSRSPLTGGGTRRYPSPSSVPPYRGHSASYATVTVPGGMPLMVESVHPMAPWSVRMAGAWRRDLAMVPAATPDGPPRLLLGDFNATLDHAPLRELLATGYRDAAAARGLGLVGTWGPYNGMLVPPVALDHVLADRRIAVDGFAVHELPGSDHHAVSATLTLPAG
ncbi:endonuclease/exonuclease/phosphatase family protein [Catenuloplanes indicus]|uniref:Endonuclease/exonuclease/phosphatase (EEP) superfamily protein YafD n=1 Tax=Catenuloplanes indicus TaxID=137267 RepID=A0AAE3W2W9_9ACTN|nr:endonuclease/exonuclease/phosphatase family protein [Catenuloplanes indicus]MDQ0368968.1 endonuclease/exonuclease/phosphatase (EEP) superfamily protein YafD [Catenuloplanes indicus]